jgi:arylsulfatase A-like enzyme
VGEPKVFLRSRRKQWSDRYKGRFDAGWDALREEIFARQKQLGIIPQDAELTTRPEAISAWAAVPDDLKPVLARQMEVYAGFMDHCDFQIGRVIDAIDELGILDDTLIIFINGDNGASAEAGPNGTFNWMIPLNGAADIETAEFMASRIDKFGTPEALNHFAVGWAWAMDTPYQWTKQIKTSARTITSASAASAGRSPTTSVSSAPSASKSPSAASPNPTQTQPARPKPPDPHPPGAGPDRPKWPGPLPRGQLISIFRVRRLGVRVPPNA